MRQRSAIQHGRGPPQTLISATSSSEARNRNHAREARARETVTSNAARYTAQQLTCGVNNLTHRHREQKNHETTTEAAKPKTGKAGTGSPCEPHTCYAHQKKASIIKAKNGAEAAERRLMATKELDRHPEAASSTKLDQAYGLVSKYTAPGQRPGRTKKPGDILARHTRRELAYTRGSIPAWWRRNEPEGVQPSRSVPKRTTVPPHREREGFTPSRIHGCPSGAAKTRTRSPGLASPGPANTGASERQPRRSRATAQPGGASGQRASAASGASTPQWGVGAPLPRPCTATSEAQWQQKIKAQDINPVIHGRPAGWPTSQRRPDGGG